MYKILLVDRCYYSRQGFRKLLSKDNTFCITDTDNLLIAREKIIQWQPNMVIADFSGFSSVLHNIQQLSAIYSACGKSTLLVVMQGGYYPNIENYCREQGTQEIASKSLALHELHSLINTRPPFRYRQQQVISLLTLREERILKLWTEAASNEMIAKVMGITTKTVYTYKRNIRMKLGADNRFSLFLSQPLEMADNGPATATVPPILLLILCFCCCTRNGVTAALNIFTNTTRSITSCQ